MILFTPKDGSKEGFNKLIMERAGGADNLSHKAIYDVAYGLYCSLVRVTDKNEALRVMVEALNDELKELRLQLKELKEENEELQDELSKRGLEIENLNELTQRSEQ